MKINILQPLIPHYREEFFEGLSKSHELKIYCYNGKSDKYSTFNHSTFANKSIRKIQFGPILIYNPMQLMRGEYKTLILMLHFGHLSTWGLLLTKFIHKKKIILWGQGISVKRYLKEERKPSILLRWMIKLADTVWLYTDKEQKQWKEIFPKKQIVSLNNTISNVDRILSFKNSKSKTELKKEHAIPQQICFIFCARFDNPYRRVDVLVNIIKSLAPEKYGFIIIGDGKYKPEFSGFSNVFDFGAVYDQSKKDDLFSIADLYLQPGWVGLSVVEAMAYGKPVVTLKRSEQTLQCVEYSYLAHLNNSIICDDLNNCINKIDNLDSKKINSMSLSAIHYVRKNLTMENMVLSASSTFA
jgi:glycosyltransferase involved in cell wall biosynthesis